MSRRLLPGSQGNIRGKYRFRRYLTDSILEKRRLRLLRQEEKRLAADEKLRLENPVNHALLIELRSKLSEACRNLSIEMYGDGSGVDFKNDRERGGGNA